jgi:pimeloyl-ACP methyl ester carboxylesterase
MAVSTPTAHPGRAAWPDVGAFEHRGRQLAYETWGQGDRPFVLLHGLLMDGTMNRRVARALAARGHRVVLLDLLGHGRSDKPRHAAEYRMDLYADQVVALLDHLGVDRAVVGGMSLGANVSLHTAVHHPDRIRGLIVEMPVLERAVPAAALTFVPALLAVHYAMPVVRLVSRVAGRVRGRGVGILDAGLAPLVLPPEATAAILHGILVGPVAPTIDQRRRIAAPALVLGHRADLIHPFTDAENLARDLPDARFVAGRAIFELRLGHRRLVDEIGRFLDEVWAGQSTSAA